MGYLLHIILILIPVLLSVAYFTILERKILAGMQRRQGPAVFGIWGLIQPLADGVKLLLKETILPVRANLILFLFAPTLTFGLSLITWAVIPFDKGIVFADLNLGLFYILAISSLGVYGLIISGWSSNSKYPFLAALRSSAQMISYEVSIGFILINILIIVGSLNLSQIVLAQESIWFIIPFFPLFLMFYISILAETGRTPFDLIEAESELVSGHSVEYSGMTFALFFLGENINMILMSSLAAILFFGGWLPLFHLTFIPGSLWFALKSILILSSMVWMRVTFPRYRYDQLMRLGWKNLLPLSLAWILFTSGIALATHILL